MDMPHTLSPIIDEILDYTNGKEQVQLGECFLAVEMRGIPVALVFASLIGMLPLSGIPGFSAVVGLIIALLGFGLLMGKEAVWLPPRINNYQIGVKKLASGLQKARPFVERLEKIFKPYWMALCRTPIRNVIGLVFILLGLLLSLPIPLTNFPISFVTGLLALGLTLQDGRVIAVGLFITIVGGAAVALALLGMI
jgi:hypothetical protein